MRLGQRPHDAYGQDWFFFPNTCCEAGNATTGNSDPAALPFGPMGDASPLVEVLVRDTPDVSRAGDWAVVLASAGIGYRTLRTDTGWGLAVAEADQGAALAALQAFDAESTPPAPEPVLPDSQPSALGIMTALGLVAFFVVTGPRDASPPSPWFGAGAAVSELILRGQWWRALTALTLHADLLHLAGNVVASVIFVGAVGRWLGSGLGAALIVAAAAGGNLLTAGAHGPGHHSVGASTATFAALGILAGLQLIRRWRLGPLRRAWLPIAAGLALFAMLGVEGGQLETRVLSDVPALQAQTPVSHVDVLAHLFGLAAGCVLGLGWALTRLPRPRAPVQIAAGALSLAAMIGAWLLAFTR
jgi:rhomboid protease GluP